MRPVAQHASSSVSSLGCIIISCRIAHNRARCDNVTARLGIRYGNQIHLRFPQTGISHVHHIDTTRCAFAASFCSSLPFSILSQQIGRRWSPKSHGQGAVKARSRRWIKLAGTYTGSPGCLLHPTTVPQPLTSLIAQRRTTRLLSWASMWLDPRSRSEQRCWTLITEYTTVAPPLLHVCVFLHAEGISPYYPLLMSPFFCSFSQRSKQRLLTNAFAGPDPGTDSSVLAKRARYYIPSLAWIPNYSFSLSVFIQVDSSHSLLCWSLNTRLSGDILAGLTVASMLIPQSVSYATSLAKLSPVTGLVRLVGRSICLASVSWSQIRYQPLSLALFTLSSELLSNWMLPPRRRRVCF